MTIYLNNKTINIDDKNIRAFEKMHNYRISDLDIRVYLMATFKDLSYDEIIKVKTTEQLEEAINNAIKYEAIDCCSIDFYRSI